MVSRRIEDQWVKSSTILCRLSSQSSRLLHHFSFAGPTTASPQILTTTDYPPQMVNDRHWTLSTRCVTSADDGHRRLEDRQDGEDEERINVETQWGLSWVGRRRRKIN